MNGSGRFELEYRRAGRILILLVVLFVPVVWTVGITSSKLLGASFGLYIFAGIWIAAIVFFSVRRLVALYRWKNKNPFNWVRPR